MPSVAKNQEPRPPSRFLSRRRSRTRGFALLLTVALLAFLLILLLGLAAYTRVETAVAGNTQRQAQARQNALLALNVAVGQLQQYAGPDTRATATADAFSPNAGTTHYTGVWDTTIPGSAAPLTWFISGNEIPAPDGTLNPLALTPGNAPAYNNTNSIELVGTNTTAAANDVRAPLIPIVVKGVPGTTATANTTIGHYAWWIGDNGVKADVVHTDLTASLNYAPFTDLANTVSTDMQARVNQQVGLGVPALTASNATTFDPRNTTAANVKLISSVVTAQQLPFVKNASGTDVGLPLLKQNYQRWSAGNFAVLASTNSAVPGLRNDLSTNPTPLGPAFSAWANYSAYMEAPDNNPFVTAEGLTSPADALRRRYKIQPVTVDSTTNTQFSVAPVLTSFCLAFSIHNDTPTTPTKLVCSIRGEVGLWNPYSSALIPEGLQLVVLGLPSVTVTDTTLGQTLVPLQTTIGDTNDASGNSPVKLLMPWPTSTIDDQTSSWLPGRVYNWTTDSSPLGTDPAAGYPMMWGVRTVSAATPGIECDTKQSPLPLVIPLPIGSPLPGRTCAVDTANIVLQLQRSTGEVLATYPLRNFSPAPCNGVADPASGAFDFAFIVRFVDPLKDSISWLQLPGRDPRMSATPAEFFPISPDPGAVVVDLNGANMTSLDSVVTINDSSLLLDRFPGTKLAPAGTSFDEDVPVFELPRSPLLSVGELQHLPLLNQQPFFLGTSLAAASNLSATAPFNNTLFDANFFSGLSAGTGWSGLATPLTTPLPNPLLRVLRHKPDGTAVDPANDFSATAAPARFLLQGGAFNLNSTDPAAWAAVLSSVRFSTTKPFNYLDAAATTGTGPDSTPATATPAAAFLRFAHSAQETYKATDPASATPYTQSDPNGTGPVLNTNFYRQGLRALSATDVQTLAQKITDAIKLRQAAAGPFLTLDEFLGPAGGIAGTPSLLEQAISDAGLNVNPNDPAGANYPFSSVFLTQADIMTALAPVLFTRSDTFTVRAYGEAVNPVTNLVEGRAWCEAVVQRYPEPLDPATPRQPTDTEYQTPPDAFGRRFKIVSFRWLSAADI